MRDLAKTSLTTSSRFIGAIVALGCIAGAATAQFDGPAPLAWRWYQSTSVPPGGTPVVDGNSIYLAVGSRMYAVEKESGNQIWRYPVGEPLAANFRSGVAMSEGLVMAAADNKTIYAVDAATGVQKWTYTAPNAILGAPIVVGKFLVFGLTDNSFMALTVSDGKPMYNNPERIFNGILGGMAAYGSNVLVMDRTFTLYSIDVASRKVNWKTPFSFASPDIHPVVYGDTIYLNTGAFLTAVRAGNGMGAWQKNIGEMTAFSPAVSPSGILVVTQTGKAVAFDINGRQISRGFIDLDAYPSADPSAVGKLYAAPTSNGSLNLIDPTSGQIVWNFIVRPITTFLQSDKPGGGTGQDTGRGLGGGLGGGSTTTQSKPQNYITAASPAILTGSTLLLQTKDGSLLAFDKSLGVDLTPPTVKMFFPLPGDVISGQPPLEFAFKLEDEASGINMSSVKATIDGNPVDFTLSRDGILSIDISSAPLNAQGKPNKNIPLQDGRRQIQITATDWMGNTSDTVYVVSIDNSLKPIGRSGQTDKDTKQGGKGGGKGGGPGLGGG